MANESNASFDCGRFDPMRTRVHVTDENGKRVTRADRRPRGRGLLMLDTQGNTIFFRTTNAISVTDERNEYGLQKLSEKTRANPLWQTEPMIPFLTCPQMTEFQFRMPSHLQTGKRCTIAADGHPIGEADGNPHPCICMASLRAERQAANIEREDSRAEKTTVMQELLANAQESTIAAQNATATMARLADHLTAKSDTPTKGNGK